METRGMAQQETETDFSPIPIVIAHCLLWSRSRVYKDRVTGQTFPRARGSLPLVPAGRVLNCSVQGLGNPGTLS